MKIKDVLSVLPYIEAHIDNGALEVEGIAFDSRQVSPGYVFFALCGSNTDGHLYLEEALKNGAVLVVGERREPLQRLSGLISWILVEDGRRALAFVSNCFYRDPSRHLRVMGITGTNGKTTTCFLTRSIWEKSGRPCGLLTTVRNLVGPWEFESINTTEESLRIFHYLHMMRRAGIQDVVMEVSSHGLAIGRVEGVHFDVALVTNLVPEHLEFHQTFEHYFSSKRKLFEKVAENLVKNYPRVAIANGDDKECLRMVQGLGVPYFTYGLEKTADVWATEVNFSLRHSRFHVFTPWGKVIAETNFAGRYNVYNALGAIALALSQGIDRESIQEGLRVCKRVPGRWEFVDAGQDFAVIVDFAHNWHGLASALSTVREFTRGKVITVFGCGGERDRKKRPLMGETVARYSDWCLITTDNPRGENPEQTAHDALEGVKRVAQEKEVRYEVILDRVEAIRRAIAIATREDVVFLAGKGPERFQVYNGAIVPHSDYWVAKRLLEERRR
ncbi:MAG: UDP-N-acetylmuramoyl-L-alanyl-D-glutamate--2,6-diaminopimelate ligase [Candidatus Atribacteria bacterium]|nr:UDP-N-acetylmuramoyl-L-alanyl-D-glutamate--2,6-diaminopimelate ligase [Candidatus Atribacteria bacterium]